MARFVGDRLPERLVRAFDGRDLQTKIGPAILLVSCDDDGAPRPCMLSAGEILAVGDERLRVALWAGTGTGRNLERGLAALLCIVDGRDVLYVKGFPRSLGRGRDGLDRFEIEVASVESDEHPGMPVVHGIEFDVVEPTREALLESWERQVSSLREA